MLFKTQLPLTQQFTGSGGGSGALITGPLRYRTLTRILAYVSLFLASITMFIISLYILAVAFFSAAVIIKAEPFLTKLKDSDRAHAYLYDDPLALLTTALPFCLMLLTMTILNIVQLVAVNNLLKATQIGMDVIAATRRVYSWRNVGLRVWRNVGFFLPLHVIVIGVVDMSGLYKSVLGQSLQRPLFAFDLIRLIVVEKFILELDAIVAKEEDYSQHQLQPDEDEELSAMPPNYAQVVNEKI